RSDEMFKFIRTDLAKTFESGDFWIFAEFPNGFDFFLVGIAVDGLLLVADTEQWSGEDVQMTPADEFREKLQEEGDHQQTDVHAVHIRIGGEDDVIVTQVVKIFLDVQRMLQKIELLVFV